MDRIDWNARWQEYQRGDSKNSTRGYWNDRAPKFRKKADGRDPYVEEFYRLMNPEPEDTLFDMGCGSGTLAIPFAKAGHEVWAADFSEEMLRCMMEDAAEEGVADRIHPIQLDWNEDWSTRGLPKCSVAFASRSLFLEDLTSSLKKLESVATKRCCLGAWEGPNTGYDRYVSRAIGFQRPGYGCHYIVMNELMDRDVYPKLDYIFTPFRKDKFESFEDGVRIIKGSFGGDLTAQQEQKLEEYFKEHLVKVETGEGEFWQMNHGTMSSVAFISWDVKTVFDE